MSLTEVFDRIYRDHEWQGGPTGSGQGSGEAERLYLAPELMDHIEMIGITSVVDIGCGEAYWQPDDLPGYIGIDVSEVALLAASGRHPDWDFRLDDGREYPASDAAIVRCVIQHLSFESGLALLDRIRAVSIHWLIATTYEVGQNVDIEDGGGYWANLTKAPFSLGAPAYSLKDGRTDAVDMGARLAFWDLWA